MSIASFATFGLVEHLHSHKLSLFVPGDNHLGDALSVVHDKILLREVDEQHAHLTTIVGIDRPRGVEYRDTLLQGQSAAGSGRAMCRPVGMSLRSMGFSTTGASRLALRSMPALCAVAYCGNG